VRAKRPYKRSAAAKTFDPGEGKVLRFYGRWTDATGSAADPRHLEVRWAGRDCRRPPPPVISASRSLPLFF